MITPERAHEMLKVLVPIMREDLQVVRWRVWTEYFYEESDDWAMKFHPEPLYLKGQISINLPAIENEELFVRYLRHELIHVHHAELFRLELVLKEALPEEVQAVTLEAFGHTVELLVRQMEDFMDFAAGKTLTYYLNKLKAADAERRREAKKKGKK